MRSYRARSFAVCVIAVGAALTGLVVDSDTATPPSVTGTKVLVNAPGALACHGLVGVQVKLRGHAEVRGTATDIVLVLDLSGSISSMALDQLQGAATALVNALDAGDGTNDGNLGLGNRVSIVTYKGSSASVPTAWSDTVSALLPTIASLGPTSGASPHGAGITRAAETLGSGPGKAIVLISDGRDDDDDAAGAASAAKSVGILIATVGVGSNIDVSALASWASPNGYQSGTSGIDSAELVGDIGAAVAVPASFTLTETPGGTFSLGNATVDTGSVSGSGSLVWTGTLAEGQTATLRYDATRIGAEPFAVTSEQVSTSALGGSGTVSGATPTIEVLPCDATTLLDQQTCSGSTCTAGGTQGGVQYSLNAGSPPAGTAIFLSALASAPPAGVCPGFDGNTNVVQFDIRPLQTTGTYEIRIPKASLGGKKWWQADVCVGTNLRFITEIGSLANLRPGARQSGDRWWGLLPSIPRYTRVPGIGLVKGPWITHRSPDGSGGAIVRFTMPYVAGSEALTTDGQAAYDPKVCGG